MSTSHVWRVYEFNNCQGEDCPQTDGVLTLAIAANEQVARQIASKIGSWAHVERVRVLTDTKGF